MQVIFCHWNINKFLRKVYKGFAFHFQTFWKARLFFFISNFWILPFHLRVGHLILVPLFLLVFITALFFLCMCYFSFAFAFFSFLLGSFTLFSFLPPACLLGPKTHPPMQACLGLRFWLSTSLKKNRFKYSFPEGESLCELTVSWTCFSCIPGNAAFLSYKAAGA